MIENVYIMLSKWLKNYLLVYLIFFLKKKLVDHSKILTLDY